MAYRDDIIATSPDYLWPFDGDLVDSVVAATAIGTSTDFNGTLICEDVSSTLRFDAIGDQVNIGGVSNVGDSITRKCVMGWIQLSSIQLPPKNIYREGSTGTTQFNIVLWAGNNIMLDVVNNGTNIQAFSDRVLRPGRSYCLLFRVEGNGFGNKVEMYLDGVKQLRTEPSNGQLGSATLPDRVGGSVMGDLSSTEVGGQEVRLNALTNGNYAMWAYWSEANAELTDTTIRELFELGALPGTTITTGTEANMQTQLDTLASTVRPDQPLNIRVEEVTGGGDFTLAADNVTHSPLASIHIQYMGTGTLNWVNNNGSNASISSAINGGTVNIINPAILTLSPLIVDTEVRIYEAGTTTEIAGIESSGALFTTSVNANSVDIVIHKEDYEYIRIRNVDISQGDVFVPVSQVFDRQYNNV